jgi:micrococcal nuclease
MRPNTVRIYVQRGFGAFAPRKEFMKTKILVFAAVLAGFAWNAQAESYRVVGITDGDTVRVVTVDHRQVKCRLHGIDAPERSQSHGQQSKQSLSDMIYLKAVDIEIVDQDQYGRSVCRIFLNGVDINKLQVQHGMAWWFKRYSHDVTYGQAEQAARQQRIGLWSDVSPTPPWAYRQNENTGKGH